MSKLKGSSFVAIIMMSFISISSSAKAVDKTQNLLSSCNAFKTATNNDKTLPCVNYIEGFLNGVLNANNADVAILLEDDQKSASLVERAYANRVGNKARKIVGAKSIDYVCLSKDKSQERIIANLSNSSLSTIHSLEQLNARLIHILKISCPAESKRE